MLIGLYTCPDCKGTGVNESIENHGVEIEKGTEFLMYDDRCMGCGGTGTLTEIEAINRKLIPNPLFANT